MNIWTIVAARVRQQSGLKQVEEITLLIDVPRRMLRASVRDAAGEEARSEAELDRAALSLFLSGANTNGMNGVKAVAMRFNERERVLIVTAWPAQGEETVTRTKY